MDLLYILAIPLISASLSMMRTSTQRVAAWATVLGTLAVFILSCNVAWSLGHGIEVSGISGWLSCDGFSALILLLVSFVGFTASLFSWGYIGHTVPENRPDRVRHYYRRFNLFLLSMLAVPLLSQIAMVWIAVELTTLLSVFLVSFENTVEAMEAAWKYVVLTCMGAALALVGILILYWGQGLTPAGAFTWVGLSEASSRIPPVFLKTAFIFILIGFGTKAGLVPLHTWLPDAHSQAPSPVCALLSGVETTTALYAILRLLPVMDAVSKDGSSTWFMVFGLISMGAAAFLLIQVRDYKRLFAYSTIEHMGIILVAAGLGGEAGHLASTYQVMTHAVTKSFCFFAAGAALLMTSTREISSVRGLIRTSPIAGISLMIGGLAIAGAPPFAVFLSEFSIFRAGLSEGRYGVTGLVILFITIAFGGIMYQVNRMVFGQGQRSPSRGPLPLSCRLTLAVTVLPVFLFGFYMPEPLHNLLRFAAACFGR
jgi:hydrogenase-4 component F